MTAHAGILGLQVDALLEEVKRQEGRRCQEIITAAERAARDLQEETRRELHRKRRQAVADERQRRRHALLEATSRIETREQSSAHARYERVLDAAWPRLVTALAHRWRQPDSRQDWCEMLVDEASAALGGSTWTVEHPADWNADDESQLLAACDARAVPAPKFLADPGIRAGVRIRLDDACVDGTLDGLLADRRSVEARILGAWERLRAQEANGDR
jgi:hypothetical protein